MKLESLPNNHLDRRTRRYGSRCHRKPSYNCNNGSKMAEEDCLGKIQNEEFTKRLVNNCTNKSGSRCKKGSIEKTLEKPGNKDQNEKRDTLSTVTKRNPVRQQKQNFKIKKNDNSHIMALSKIRIAQFTQKSYDTLDEQYSDNYGHHYYENLKRKMPDLSNCLQNINLSSANRSRMVNWLLEVVGNFKKCLSDYTFFKAITIMDLYFKHVLHIGTNDVIGKQEMQVIVVSSFFLASKFEDRYPVSFEDLYQKALKGWHDLIPKSAIRNKEQEIFQILDFNLTFPSA